MYLLSLAGRETDPYMVQRSWEAAILIETLANAGGS